MMGSGHCGQASMHAMLAYILTPHGCSFWWQTTLRAFKD